MEGKATDILKDIMQKLSMINSDEAQEVDNVDVVAEEVSAEVEVKEEIELSEEVEEVVEETTELAEDSIEETQDEVEEEAEVEEMEDDKYISREEFDAKISELWI